MEYFQSIKSHFDSTKMVNMVRSRKDSIESSPKAEVGEIDTRAPFQSVRAAVSLFGETISSTPSNKQSSFKKPKSQFEGVLDKEAEFHLAQKELGKFKSQVRNAENAANKALPDLEKAMKTLTDLKDKIKAVNASKETITRETEALKNKVIELEEAKSSKQDGKGKIGNADDLEISRQEYKTASSELDEAKQELRSLRGDFEAAMEAKCISFQIMEEAQLATKAHSEKVNELSKEIESMKASLEEQTKASADRDEEERSRRFEKEEVERKLSALLEETEKEGFDKAEDLELKLEETNKEIEDLKEQIIQEKEALSESERNAYYELSDAIDTLKEVERERQSLEEEIEAFKVELASIGKEIAEIKEKESLVGHLQKELQELKLELQVAVENETRDANALSEMTEKLDRILFEVEQFREEAQELSKNIEEMRREVDNGREMEKKLETSLKEARNELKILSERKDDPYNEDEKRGLSKEDYDVMKERITESERMAEMKVECAKVELEALKESKIEVEKKLNETLKEIYELDKATEEAFSQAEMSEMAKSIAETELRRRRQQQQQQQQH